MKLTHVKIRNFRALHNIEFNVENLTSLIGKNNCGKSSILRAIELVCTGTKPELEEFHKRAFENNIEIEVVFENIQDWERNTGAVSGLIYDNKLHLRYTSSISQDEGGKQKVDLKYEAYKREEDITGWADAWGQLADPIKAIAADIGIDNGTKFKSAASKELLKQHLREQHAGLVVYGDAQWSDDSISFPTALQQAIPKVIIIPAVKDASEEMKVLKTSGKSAFGDLMKTLILPGIQAEPRYMDIQAAIAAFSERVHGEDGIEGIRHINTRLSDRLSRLINARATIRFDNPEIEALISSSVGLRIIDGEHDTPIGLQGHGLQRTLIFSLLELVAENEAALNAERTRTTLLLFEEPELYLHPQMLRKLKAILRTISEADAWQVVCSTHSPAFIDVAECPQSLVILTRNHAGAIALKQITDNPFEDSEGGRIERDALRAALDFHPTVCEVFFASSVVLVEGDTEMAILKHCNDLLVLCGVDTSSALDCTIVSCGGKWTIPAVARLLRHYHIPFKIVHDMDRKGKSLEELAEAPAIHPFNANARIAALCDVGSLLINEDTLEDLWHGAKSDKPFGAIRKISALVEANEVPESLRDMVTFVYDGFMVPPADAGDAGGIMLETA